MGRRIIIFEDLGVVYGARDSLCWGLEGCSVIVIFSVRRMLDHCTFYSVLLTLSSLALYRCHSGLETWWPVDYDHIRVHLSASILDVCVASARSDKYNSQNPFTVLRYIVSRW